MGEIIQFRETDVRCEVENLIENLLLFQALLDDTGSFSFNMLQNQNIHTLILDDIILIFLLVQAYQPVVNLFVSLPSSQRFFTVVILRSRQATKNLMGLIHPIDSSLSLRMTRTKRFDALVDDKITQFRNEQFVCQLLKEQRLLGFW